MTTNTTPSTASQAPAVSICYDDKFRALLCEVADESVMCETAWEAGLVAYIDAKLAQAAQDKTDYANQLIEDCRKLRDCATAAEAKLEAIRQGAEGLQEYSPAFKVIGGMAKSNDGGWLCKEELLALLQPQHKADESGLPG